MDRISKLAIVIWATAALLLESYYVSGSWPLGGRLGVMLFAATALGSVLDRRVVAPVLAASYLVPIFVFTIAGRYHVTYSVVWLSPLLGAVAPSALRSGWNMPQRWRVPLVCWIGGVCVAAPVVVLRAVDFHRDLLYRGRVPTEALGGSPIVTITWVLHVALLLVIAALWFDWLLGQDESFLRRWIAGPLAASMAIQALVCGYQMFVDVTFLNYSVYQMFRRASGTVLDGNVAGALAACWIGGWAIVAAESGGARRVAAFGMALLMWLAVWSTGSRTALAIAALTTVFSALAFDLRRVPARKIIAASAAAAAAVLVLVVVLSRTATGAAGPVDRIRGALPSATADGVSTFATEMWNRQGYGVAATRAISAYPLFGVGVGAFHELASDFIPNGITPDNAQNWYRHQVAEFGVVGSLGWIVFLWSFATWLLRPAVSGRASAWPARGILLSVGLVSLLGMPGQDPFVAITLSTLAAWCVIVRGRHPDAAPPGRMAWIVAGVVIAALGAGTLELANGRLRVPARMQRLNKDYVYGFWWPEPDGEGGEFRWARRTATAVVPSTTRSLELTLRINADMAQQPRHVRAWVDGKPVIDRSLTHDENSVSASVLLPEGERRALIDTSADYSVTMPPPDGRELAVMVRWRFLPSSR